MLKVRYCLVFIIICMLTLSGCTLRTSNDINGIQQVEGQQQQNESSEIKEGSRQTQSSQEQKESNAAANASQGNIDMSEVTSGTNKIEIAYGEKSLFTTDDEKIVNTIASYLKQCDEPFINPELVKLPMWEDNKIILYKRDGSKRQVNYLGDYLKEIAYVEIENQKLSMDFDFFSYIENLLRYNNHFTDAAHDVTELFSKYGWTVGYRVNSLVMELPEDLKHSTGELPFELYWANCNELSGSIGLDFGCYLGKQVDVELYCINEKLPKSIHRSSDARGIIIRCDGKIIGAYLDGGYNGCTCSLEGKTLEDVVHKDWDTWVMDYIDYDDEYEKHLTKLGPEDIITEYFTALNSHDLRKSLGCKTRDAQYSVLSRNIDINRLFNEDYDEDIIVKAVLLNIEKWNTDSNNENRIKYYVSVDYEFTKYFAPGEGPHFVTVVRNDRLGWRILGLGTGP